MNWCVYTWFLKKILVGAVLLGKPHFLGGIRGTLKREPLLNPPLALLTRDLIQRV